MFFAHLQHLCLLDMPSVGCTVSAPSPCTPACIHSNTHTCTKYVSCCILATGKVITERAKELACCRAADLIPAIEKQEGRDFHCVAQHSTSTSMLLNFFFVSSKWTVLDLTSISAILLFAPQNVCLCLQVVRLWTKRKDESVM